MTVDEFIDSLIAREGGFVDHPADRGGPTKYGITEGVARAQGYQGDMRSLSIGTAREIYKRIYWFKPGFDLVAQRSARVAEELLDTGVNMGPAVAVTFLQRALTALNREQKDYADLVPDGWIGAITIAALVAFLNARGKALGETILLRALDALQGERYIRLAERTPSQEQFLNGWLANRLGNVK